MGIRLTIKQGARYTRWLSWEVQDASGNWVGRPLTGLQARMQMRRKIGGEVLFELRSHVTASSRIEIEPDEGAGPVIGAIRLVMGARDTALMDRGGVWDVELFNPNDLDEVYRLAGGDFVIDKQVTVGAEELV